MDSSVGDRRAYLDSQAGQGLRSGINRHIDSRAGPDNPGFVTRHPIRGKTVIYNSDLDRQRVLGMSIIEPQGDGNSVVGLVLL